MTTQPAIQETDDTEYAPPRETSNVAPVPEPAPDPMVRPRPEDFQHYAPYLRAMIAHLKATTQRFSYRYFSRRAGFRSPNFLKLVADGQRNLTTTSIPKFAKGLGLSDRERDAFETLVLMSLATTDEERNRYYSRLRRFAKSTSPVHRLQGAEYDLYSLWYVIPIRELMLHHDFREDPAWIAKRLFPRIKPSEAKRALEILERIGLAKRDEQGKLQASDEKLTTAQILRSLAVRNFHRAMLEVAGNAIDQVPQDDRDVTSCTISINRAQYQELVRLSQQFRADVLETLGSAPDPDPDCDVYHLAIQLFPLTKR